MLQNGPLSQFMGESDVEALFLMEKVPFPFA